MQEDFYPVAEKILSDIHQILVKDPKLNSFEILPAQQYQNKSPIHLEEHSLALESWCVPHIYCYAYKTLMKLRESHGKIQDVEKYDSLLIGALLLNPDITTLWNMRKELIASGKLDPLFELHLTSVILTFKPKCADIYSFRKWILNRLMHGGSANNTDPVENEINICEAAADRYPNNYHAWTHRIWCLSHTSPTLLQREWVSSEKWIERHVSEYSGFHYRQKLLSFLLSYVQRSSFDSENIKLIIFRVDEVTDSFLHNVKNLELTIQSIPLTLKLLIHELSMNTDLIQCFIGHEALWCHRRYIFYEIKKVLFNHDTSSWGYFETSNHSTSEGVPIEKTLKMEVGNVGDQFSLILSIYEDNFLNKSSDESEPRQTMYANKHKQWLSKFSKFQLPYNTDNCSS